MNKKIITINSLVMGVLLTASAYATPGDCDKLVKGNWVGTVVAIEGGKQYCSKYPVGTPVKAYFNPYEIQTPITDTVCNLNWVGADGPIGPQDSTVTLGSDAPGKLQPSSILPDMDGSFNTANINLSDAITGTPGEFGGSFIVFHPQLTSGCALKIQINK